MSIKKIIENMTSNKIEWREIICYVSIADSKKFWIKVLLLLLKE